MWRALVRASGCARVGNMWDRKPAGCQAGADYARCNTRALDTCAGGTAAVRLCCEGRLAKQGCAPRMQEAQAGRAYAYLPNRCHGLCEGRAPGSTQRACPSPGVHTPSNQQGFSTCSCLSHRWAFDGNCCFTLVTGRPGLVLQKRVQSPGTHKIA